MNEVFCFWSSLSSLLSSHRLCCHLFSLYLNLCVCFFFSQSKSVFLSLCVFMYGKSLCVNICCEGDCVTEILHRTIVILANHPALIRNPMVLIHLLQPIVVVVVRLNSYPSIPNVATEPIDVSFQRLHNNDQPHYFPSLIDHYRNKNNNKTNHINCA